MVFTVGMHCISTTLKQRLGANKRIMEKKIASFLINTFGFYSVNKKKKKKKNSGAFGSLLTVEN